LHPPRRLKEARSIREHEIIPGSQAPPFGSPGIQRSTFRNVMNQIHQIHHGPAKPMLDVLMSLTGLCSSDAGQIIAMGGAYLGKFRCKDPSKLVKPSQAVSAYWRLPLVMEPVTFDPGWIVHDDGTILVADKPSGMPTQGRRDADYMAFYEVLKSNLKGYLGLHHRLDQDTSGLMLFARAKSINKAISNAFQTRKIEKTYMAICESWADASHEILVDAPLAPLRNSNGTRQIVSPKGKPAQTRFQLLAKSAGSCLVLAKPLTGRTHQIRAHLSHLSMPLAGDSLYGSKSPSPFLLHCCRLAWPRLGELPGHQFQALPPQTWQARLPIPLVNAMTQWEESPC